MSFVVKTPKLPPIGAVSDINAAVGVQVVPENVNSTSYRISGQNVKVI